MILVHARLPGPPCSLAPPSHLVIRSPAKLSRQVPRRYANRFCEEIVATYSDPIE